MGDFDPRWLLFSLLGIVSTWVQGLVKWVTDTLLDYFVSSIEIANDSPTFDYTLQWIQAQPGSSKFKSLTVERLNYSDYPPAKSRIFMQYDQPNDFPGTRSNKKPLPVVSIASGTHFIWHKKRPLWIHKSKIQDSNFHADTVPREVLTLRTLGKDTSYIKELLQEIIDLAYDSSKQIIEVRASSNGGWANPCLRRPRPQESVILPEGVLENLTADCRWFIDSENWYYSLSIPYRRGYLLHGVPGSGKSITIHCLATVLKANIWCINLGDNTLGDAYLLQMIHSIPSNDIVLLEDIDRIKVTNKEIQEESTSPWPNNSKGVTLSGILNALDGLASQEGRLVFMTTNHKEKLDPALIRPGRVDYQQEFGFADYSQASRFFIKFFPDADADSVKEFSSLVATRQIPMAELQQILLANRRNPELAVKSLENLVCSNEP